MPSKIKKYPGWDNRVRFRKLSSRNRVVVASRRYASISLPSPCYRCARPCVHPMATPDSPKNSDLLTRCLTVDHGLRSVRLYFSDSASKNSQLSRSPRRSCRCPLIPRNRTRFHREDPREERGMSIFFSLFFSLRNSLDRWMRALNIQREGRLFFFFFFFLHPPGGWETHSGLKHSDERWFRCTREQREETGRNGVGVRSLSPSLLPPSQPPRARPSPDRGGACAWPSVGVADATTFEARVCFRGKLDIEPIFLPSRFLSIKKLRLFLC